MSGSYSEMSDAYREMRGADGGRYTGGKGSRRSGRGRRYIVNNLISKGMEHQRVNRELKFNNLKGNDYGNKH
jgi:hypothetical protein